MKILVWLVVMGCIIFQVASAQMNVGLDEQYYADADQVVRLLEERHGCRKDIDLALDYLTRDNAQFDYESLIFPAALCLFACICCCIKKSCVLAFPHTKKLPIIRDIVRNVNEARASRNASGATTTSVSDSVSIQEEVV